VGGWASKLVCMCWSTWEVVKDELPDRFEDRARIEITGPSVVEKGQRGSHDQASCQTDRLRIAEFLSLFPFLLPTASFHQRAHHHDTALSSAGADLAQPLVYLYLHSVALLFSRTGGHTPPPSS
jgi:hypothetical protein